ncbi:MAG: glycosyltransferase family 39 protein [Deltaproteobacteria bacterium]
MLVFLAIVRIAYVAWGPLDLSPDEAHYWEWSRRMALSYYSKGPLVAYTIAVTTGVLGNTELGVRIGAIVFSSLGCYVIYLLGRDFFEDENIGFYAGLIPNITPIFSIGSIFMTPDVLLVFFWAASALCLKRALSSGSGAYWYAAGALIGAGFLGKYTIALVYPCLILFFLFSKPQRQWLLRKEFYIMGLISLAFASPVIIWNIANEQVTIRHTLGQAHLGNAGVAAWPAGLSLIQGLEFIGSQAALLSPLIFLMLIYGIWGALKGWLKEKGASHGLIFFLSAPVIFFFTIKAFHGKVQANWALAAYITAFPAGIWALYNARKTHGAGRKRGLVTAITFIGVLSGALLSLATHSPGLVKDIIGEAALRKPPYNRVMGWEELGQKVSSIVPLMGEKVFIMSDTYQATGELAFYVKGNPVAYNIDTGNRRMNQYDLWPGPDSLVSYNAVYVKLGDSGIESMVAEAFERCEKEAFKYFRGKVSVKDFTIFRCTDFKGLKRPETEKRY